MNLTRRLAGYILLIAGVGLIALHLVTIDGSDVTGLPTFLGIGVVFLIFGILTTITCAMGQMECEAVAP
jgi:Na+-transporting methylmalonyl-CoA/oxaloacetate decarboxylase gamma subunit